MSRQTIGALKSLFAAGVNSFVWSLDVGGGVKFYHQTSNATDTNARALTAAGVFYSEPKYYGYQAGVVSGAFGVSVRGLGNMVLTANNTYTGTTTVEQGANLQIGNGGANGAISGSLQINSGGVATYYSSSASYSIAYNITGSGLLNFKGTGGASGTGSFAPNGTNTFSGPVILSQARLQLTTGKSVGTGPITVNFGSQIYLSGATLANAVSIAGNGWVEGAGALGAIRYESAAVISGAINVASAAKIQNYLAATDTLSITGAISGAGLLTFDSRAGALGTVTLAGANTYSGGTIVNLGLVIADNNIANTLRFGTGPISIKAGATARIRTAASYQPTYPNSFSGAGTLEVSSSGSNRVNFSGSFVGLSNIAISSPGTPTDTVWYGVVGSCRGDTGLALSCTASGNLALESGASPVTYTLGSLSGDNTTQIYGSNSGNGLVSLNVGALNTNTTYAGVIKNSWSSVGKLSLVKVGTGTLTLSGANLYTDATSVQGGTLALSGSGSVSGSAGVVVSAGATFDTSAVTTSATINSLAGGGGVNVGAKPLTIANNGTSTYSGVMAGSALVTLSAGALTLTGNSSKTGGWTVNGGTLTFAGGLFGSGILRGTLTVNSGGVAVIDLSGSADPAYSNDSITVNAGGNVNYKGTRTSYLLGFNLVNNGTAAATVTSDNSTGGMQSGNGVLGQVGFINSTGTGNGLANTVSCKVKLINNGAGGSFTFNPSTAPLIVSGIIDDFSGLAGLQAQKAGTGALTLSGANTNSGGFNLTAGLTNVTSTNVGPFVVGSAAIISGGSVATGTVGALTFSALASKLQVNAITTSSASKLTCSTLTAASGFTINVVGAMVAGTYPILVSTTGTPTPTLGTNTSGRTVAFAWSGQTLNMVLT